MARDPREYGLNRSDREYEISRKFGAEKLTEVDKILQQVIDPNDQILGAVVFLAREGNFSDLDDLVRLANENREGLLRAAVVKDERG